MEYIYIAPPGSSIHGILQAGILEWGCHVLLQGIFPTQGLNPGLPHCGQTLYPLSHQRSLVSGHLLRCSDTVPPPHGAMPHLPSIPQLDRQAHPTEVSRARLSPEAGSGGGGFGTGTQLPVHSAEARRHAMSTAGLPLPRRRAGSAA